MGGRASETGSGIQATGRSPYPSPPAPWSQVAPSLAINYASYETLRSSWLLATDRTTPTVPMSLACGSVAGLVSSTATFPLDLVRRRLQVQGCSSGGGSGGSGGSGGMPQAARATFRSVLSGVVQVRPRSQTSALLLSSTARFHPSPLPGAHLDASRCVAPPTPFHGRRSTRLHQ